MKLNPALNATPDQLETGRRLERLLSDLLTDADAMHVPAHHHRPKISVVSHYYIANH